jgi:hypothetical protein
MSDAVRLVLAPPGVHNAGGTFSAAAAGELWEGKGWVYSMASAELSTTGGQVPLHPP